jgi:hypothetical protein
LLAARPLSLLAWDAGLIEPRRILQCSQTEAMLSLQVVLPICMMLLQTAQKIR